MHCRCLCSQSLLDSCKTLYSELAQFVHKRNCSHSQSLLDSCKKLYSELAQLIQKKHYSLAPLSSKSCSLCSPWQPQKSRQFWWAGPGVEVKVPLMVINSGGPGQVWSSKSHRWGVKSLSKSEFQTVTILIAAPCLPFASRARDDCFTSTCETSPNLIFSHKAEQGCKRSVT